MLKEYRKTAIIKAEQFDGSDEMVRKYNLYPALKVGGIPIVYFFGNSYIAKGDIMIFAKSEDDEWYPLKSMNKDEFHQTYEEVKAMINVPVSLEVSFTVKSDSKVTKDFIAILSGYKRISPIKRTRKHQIERAKFMDHTGYEWSQWWHKAARKPKRWKK